MKEYFVTELYCHKRDFLGKLCVLSLKFQPFFPENIYEYKILLGSLEQNIIHIKY